MEDSHLQEHIERVLQMAQDRVAAPSGDASSLYIEVCM